MKIQTILLVLGGLIFLAVIMIFIHLEGQRFREQLKETADTSVRDGMNEAAENAAVKAVDRAADRIEGVITKGLEIPGKILGGQSKDDSEDDSQKSSDEDSPKNKKTSDSDKPDTDGNDRDKSGDKNRNESDSKVPSTSSDSPNEQDAQDDKKDIDTTSQKQKRSPEPEEPKQELEEQKKQGTDLGLGSIFDLGNEVVKQADRVGQEFVQLSVEEENEIGDQVHASFKRDLNLSTNPQDSKRLEQLAQPFLKHIEKDGTVYKFYVVNDEHINAFTHIGGHVYFHRGLLDLLETDQRIQFVLGHEIAHGELGHPAKGVAYAARAGQLGGSFGRDVAMIVHQSLTQGYSDDDEFDADKWSCRTMIKEGGSRADVVDSLGVLLKYDKQQAGTPESDSQNDDAGDDLSKEIDGHFRSHPATQERIDRILNNFPEK